MVKRVGEGFHRGLAVRVVEVVVQIEDLRGVVAQPRQCLAVGDAVVGAEAGEMVPEGVQIEPLGIRQADLVGDRLETLE